MKLWPFQDSTVQAVRDAIRAGHRSILIVAPTGSGKTVMGSHIIHSAEQKEKTSMFMAHRRELVNQTADKLRKFGVLHGIIMAGKQGDMWRGAQIASIDTLRSRYMNPKKKCRPLPHVDVLMIDEAHRSCSPTYTQLIDHYKAEGAIVIGLTATPIRGDGKGLARHYDCLIEAASMQELIDLGFLVQPRYFVPTIPDLTGVKVARGDYVEGQLEAVMDRREPVGDVVSNWIRIHQITGSPIRQTIAFTPGVKSSIHLCEEFNAAGYRFAHIDGTTPKDERDDILQRLAKKDLQGVTNCMVLTEGFDCPELSCAIIYRPTKNLGLFIQMAGRVFRAFPGKEDAWVIDHSGNLYEHGFIEEDHGWQLKETDACISTEERQKNLDEKKPITCMNCSHVYTGQLVCPKCGHMPQKRGEAIESRHADLIEVRKGKRAEQEASKEKKKTFTKEEKQLWYSMFYKYALDKGHKEGSVAHKYKEKFGVWPKDMAKVPVTPSPQCLSYIKHLNIKNHHRKKAIREMRDRESKSNYVPSDDRPSSKKNESVSASGAEAGRSAA